MEEKLGSRLCLTSVLKMPASPTLRESSPFPRQPVSGRELTHGALGRIDPTFPPQVQNLFPDLSFVTLLFTFNCKSGPCSG